jgi:hypothetical protein
LIFAVTFGIWSPAFSKTQSGVVTVEVDLSAKAQGQSARLWVPYPVSDRDQIIGDIHTSGDYSDGGIYTDRENGTPMLYFVYRITYREK